MDTKSPLGGHHGAVSFAALAVAACCLAAAFNSLGTLQLAEGSTALSKAFIGIGGIVGTGAGLWVSLSHAALARALKGSPRALVVVVRLARRFATPSVRRALAGMSVSGTLLASPALAEPATSDVAPDLGWSTSTSLRSFERDDPSRLDLGFGSRPFLATTTDPGPALAIESLVPPPQGSRYTVRPGDTLWSIAEQHLREGASTPDIAAAADAWFQANSDHILDPNLIHPGQLLISPEETS